MNKIRKIIIAIYATIIFVMCFLVVPFSMHFDENDNIDIIYCPIWSNNPYYSVNLTRLLIQIFATTIIFAVIYLLVDKKTGGKNN